VSQSKPFKILYLMDYYYGPSAGTELQLLELIENLDRTKFQPHLAVFRESEYLIENPFPCPVTVLNIGSLANPQTLVRLYRFSRFIRRSGYELVHIFLNDASIAAPLFCKAGGARVIVSRRDMGFWYRPLNLAVLKISNYFVDRIVSNSHAVGENVSHKEHFPEEKIVVIYNGHRSERFAAPAAPDFRSSHGIGPQDPIIGMVANLYEIKRQSDLIEAFAIAQKKFSTLHLVFVGEGREHDALWKHVLSLGLENRVHFLGSMGETIPIIKHFTAGVLCSESEGQSNAIIEYMGCGKPTLCTRVGGNPEVVREGCEGYLIGVGDVESLAQRMIEILSDPSLAKRLGENARRRVAQDFSTEKMVNSYMHLYEEMI
jgi:L-malate glycosyltransferase